MAFNESMLPETHHIKDGPVVLVDQDEYKALVRDSVFARNFAELIVEDFTFLPQSMRTMLRLYDNELYMKLRQSAESKPEVYPRTPSSAIADLMRTYKENHGEDGENE